MLGNVDLFADKIKCDYEKVNEDSGITEVVKRYFELLEEGKKEGFIPVFVEVKDYFNEEFPEFEEYKIRENVGLFKVPADKAYEISAWFLFGGFNECPLPEEIIAISKYWYEKYNARVVAITDSEMEFYLEKFPETQKEAEELAIEQFLVSEDLVFQIYDELEELSKELYKAKNWYFWWD